MKQLLLCLVVGLSFTSKAQCGTITAHSIVPDPIYDTTQSYLNLQVYCNEMITLVNQNVSVVGNTIMVDAFYCYGWLQVITTTNDSISLGVLPAGDYNYNVTVYSSYSPMTNCQTFTITDNAAGLFTVNPIVNSVPELETTGFVVYPNPSDGDLFWKGNEDVKELVIYSLEGSEVFRSEANNGNLKLPENIKEGVYFVKPVFASGRSSVPVKLIIE
jgi:hypothetical protein